MTQDEQWDAIQKSIGLKRTEAVRQWNIARDSQDEILRLDALMWQVRRIRHMNLPVDPLMWKLTHG